MPLRFALLPAGQDPDDLVRSKGLAAFEAFFSAMPSDADPGMAFILVQHLAPDHKSMLAELIRRVEPTGNAKYVEFVTLADRAQMPGLRSGVLDWPYVEGLRLDEAMHPLTLLSFGMYGEVLPNQNGAPVRLVTPWKYGFKSAKSIVEIRFTESERSNELTRWAAESRSSTPSPSMAVRSVGWSSWSSSARICSVNWGISTSRTARGCPVPRAWPDSTCGRRPTSS